MDLTARCGGELSKTIMAWFVKLGCQTPGNLAGAQLSDLAAATGYPAELPARALDAKGGKARGKDGAGKGKGQGQSRRQKEVLPMWLPPEAGGAKLTSRRSGW